MVTTRRQARGEGSPVPPSPKPPSPVTEKDLPPPKQDKGVRSVSPPLRDVSLSSFFYALVFVASAVALCYAYHAAQMAVGLVRNTVPSVPGMHWGMGFSGREKKPETGREEVPRANGALTVESRIEELAAALGVPSPELASAIAGAVREYVPPASLSSVAKEAKKTGGSKVVDALVGNKDDEQPSRGVIGGVGEAFGKVVGMDDVPEEVV